MINNSLIKERIIQKTYSLTPPSSPSPAPPEDSLTADDLLGYAELVCWGRPRSGAKKKFWPIFDGPSVAVKRDEPDRMTDAPISGDGDDDGANGTIQCVALSVTGGRR